MHGALYIHIHLQCTNVHIKLVWVCCIHPSKLQTLRVIDFMLSASAAAPSDRFAAVRIEAIKGEVKGSMFPSLSIEDKYIRWPRMA